MPQELYRVFDDRSVSKYHDGYGFRAGAPGVHFDPYDKDYIIWAKLIVEQHANWYSRLPSPLISTTSSYDEALQYAHQRHERGNGNVHITIIDASILEQENIFTYHMSALVAHTRAQIAEEAYSESEIVCQSIIPEIAVIQVYDLSGFQSYCDEKHEIGQATGVV